MKSLHSLHYLCSASSQEVLCIVLSDCGDSRTAELEHNYRDAGLIIEMRG